MFLLLVVVREFNSRIVLESVAVNAVLLPALTTLNTRLGYLSTLRLDMWVIQVSLVLGFVGQLLVWSAHVPATMIGGIIIYSLATGLGPALQSISVSFVDKIHTARMFTMFAAVMTCGTMIGNPLMATLFSFGMKLGGEWLGLGYLAAAVRVPCLPFKASVLTDTRSSCFLLHLRFPSRLSCRRKQRTEWPRCG